MKINKSQDTVTLRHKIEQYETIFKKLIRDRFGIVIQKNYYNLNKIILKACQKFNLTPEDYLKILKNDLSSSNILEHLITEITIQESYFFRDKHQTDLLQNTLLPELIQKKRQKNNLSLRIWSAGCARGEEIYTLAMQLNELLPDIKNWHLNLLGTDIDTKALQKATQGEYSKWSMRSINDYFRNKYFYSDDNEYRLNESIRKMVIFSYLNLIEDDYPSIATGTNAQDIILCRNVLIYFDETHVKFLMKRLSMCLTLGGYLLLGASDPISTKDTDLVLDTNKAIVLHKPETATIKTKIIPEKIILTPIPKKITPKTHVTKKISPPLEKMATAKDISKLLDEGKWNEVLALSLTAEENGTQSPLILNAKATALANLGQLEQAADAAEKSLKLDPANYDSYFILALILVELEKIDEAESALRKALFLNNQFVAAHFQLGLLLMKDKRRELGLKCLRNALVIAQKQNPNDPVAGFKGLYYGRLAEILKKEIDIYSVYGEH